MHLKRLGIGVSFAPRRLRHLPYPKININSIESHKNEFSKNVFPNSSMLRTELLVITSALPRLLPLRRVCKILAGHTTLFVQDLITVLESRIS